MDKGINGTGVGIAVAVAAGAWVGVGSARIGISVAAGSDADALADASEGCGGPLQAESEADRTIAMITQCAVLTFFMVALSSLLSVARQARHIYRRYAFGKLTITTAVRVLSAWTKEGTSEPAWARGEISESMCDWEYGSTLAKQRLPPIFGPAV
jgi:hypothetical protein